jgi:ankyrin repeat protein
MDPVGTLWSIAAIVVTLQEFVESYEDAPASLLSIKAQIQVVETGVRRVQEWLHFTDPRSRAEVQESLQAAIATVDSSMKSLKGTLDSILHPGPRATKLLGRQGSDKWTQTKFAWNEKVLNRHLTDMRECALLLTFTLTVCQLPTGRPAGHEIEELGNVARTLSRAHKSTRSRRRAVLMEAKGVTSQDQSPDLRVLIEGVLAAEDEFPEEEYTGDGILKSTTVLPATRRRLQKKRQSSEPSVAFLDTENTASRTRNDELFFGGPTIAPERRPVIPSKSSQSILRKPLPSRNGSSADDLNRSRAEQPPGMLVNPMRQMNSGARSTPNLIASTAPEVGTPLLHRDTFPREPVQPMSSNESGNSLQSLESDRVRVQSPEQVTHATGEPPSHLTTPTEWQSARPVDPAHEEGMRQVLSLDMPEKGSYTVDSRSSSPPPYLSPTMSQLTLSDNGDASAPEQAPIPISAEVLESKLAVVANKEIDSSTCPVLIHAVRMNDEDLVKSLLEQGADTDEQDQDTACTALMEAARLSRREMCRRLLQSGSRLSHKDVEGRTALHMAATRDDAIVCRMLLDAGAQVSICDQQNRTPLRLAAQSGSHEAVACLLETIPASKATSNDPEITAPFFEAVRLGDTASAQEFLAKHIDLKAIKDTPRLAACASQSGSIQMLNLVLVQKGSLKATGTDGHTVLHFAAQEGHPAMVEHLLSKGISWKAQTKKRKETALHLAITANQLSAALSLIQHKDAKVTVSDSDSQEPLHQATRAGSLPIVTALLSHGAKLKTTNSYGWKPSHLAAAYGHAPLMATFITHGIDLEDRLSSPSFKPGKKTNEAAQRGYWAEIRWPHEDARALHLAIEFGHVEMAKLLLAAGAKADNAPDSQRWQPLHYAAFNCEPEIVEVLLDKGASPHATTQDGNTPLSLGFREYGLVVSEDAKARVRILLQEASAKKQKSGLAQVLQFRLGSAGTKSAGERNRIYHTAEMAEALYRDGGALASDDADSQVSEDRGTSAMSSSLTLSAVDRRTSSLSVR